MSTCQFCKEEVHQEAIKCRHCGSFLGEVVEKTERAQVTYVVDRDIVRFAKFALSILLIFLIAGAFLYGFDIRIAAREIREFREDIRKDRDAIKLFKDELTGLHGNAEVISTEATESLTQAKEQLGETKGQLNSFHNLVQEAKESIEENLDAIETLKKDVNELYEESKGLVTKTADSLTQANEKVEQIEGQTSSLATKIEFLSARLGTAQDVLSTVVDRTSNDTLRPATESDDEAILAEFFSRHRDSVLVVAERYNGGTVDFATGLLFLREDIS